MTPGAGSRGTLLVAAALLLAGVVAACAALIVESAAAATSPGAVVSAGDATEAASPRDAPVPWRAEPTTTAHAPDSAAPAVGSAAAPPRRLQVPALGIDAHVGDLGLTSEGRLEVPATADEVGWWSGGSTPGDHGPIVLAAHVDWEGRPGVFQRLTDLVPGDVIVVLAADGTEHEYRVEHLEQHPKDRFPTEAVYGETDDPTLRLITCGGPFDEETANYLDNVIVFARPTDR